MQKADVVLLLGARTNWMLHFARPPRFSPDVKIIQVDFVAEEHHNSIKSEVAIQSDMKPAVEQITVGLKKMGFNFNKENEWWKDLSKKCTDNQKAIQASIYESIYICALIFIFISKRNYYFFFSGNGIRQLSSPQLLCCFQKYL